MFLKIQKNILLLTVMFILSAGWVLAQPALTFSPVDGATDVAEGTTITISSSMALRRDSDNAGLTNGNVASVLTLRLNNAFGDNIPFTATINGGDDLITITPSSPLPSNQVVYVASGNVEATDGTNLANDPTSITFTTGDTQTPSVSFTPANSASNIAITTSITVTFNEPIQNIDDSEITNGNVASLITLKETDNSGADVPFTATINAGKTEIVIDPTGPLSNNQVYYVSIAPVEDASDNATTATDITF
ncbi:MAG TPA: Ig-like domain-containing protein, partial [Ohtaekwangia sp.]|nr:Ig-like domain-containing protein [Ohtaekwangia sp.]